MAYVCICNAISEDDIRENPALIHECGTGCGTCLSHPILSEESELDQYKDLLDQIERDLENGGVLDE